VLASREVVADLDGLVVRPLGKFALLGKSESLDLVEIMGRTEENSGLTTFVRAFESALAAFDAEQWNDAVHRLRTLVTEFPNDGPTAYFLGLAEAYAQNPSAHGTARPIRVTLK
jgi:adenylate cyclase